MLTFLLDFVALRVCTANTGNIRQQHLLCNWFYSGEIILVKDVYYSKSNIWSATESTLWNNLMQPVYISNSNITAFLKHSEPLHVYAVCLESLYVIDRQTDIQNVQKVDTWPWSWCNLCRCYSNICHQFWYTLFAIFVYCYSYSFSSLIQSWSYMTHWCTQWQLHEGMVCWSWSEGTGESWRQPFKTLYVCSADLLTQHDLSNTLVAEWSQIPSDSLQWLELIKSKLRAHLVGDVLQLDHTV